MSPWLIGGLTLLGTLGGAAATTPAATPKGPTMRTGTQLQAELAECRRIGGEARRVERERREAAQTAQATTRGDER